MKHYPVLAEFEDKRTGNRHVAGGTFKPHDTAQFERLRDAGCLGKDPVTASDKSVDDMSRAELEAAAADAFAARVAEISDDELREGLRRNAGSSERDADADEGNDTDQEGADVSKQDPAAKAREQINEDGLFDKSAAQLKKIVEDEQVGVAGLTKKADIIAAIRAKRAAA